MSFFSGFFASSTPSAAPPPPTRHGKKASVQLGVPSNARRTLGREDDEVYGPASPRLQDHNGFEVYQHDPYAAVHTSTIPSPPVQTSSYPPRAPSGPSPDPSVLGHRSRPSVTARLKPFFSETLAAPLGMGRGEPIPNPLFSTGHPPLRQTWSRISHALSAVPELPESLSTPASSSSIRRLEKVLLARDERLRLPRSVKEHFLVHDGQDPFATHSGAVFGSGEGSGLVWGLWVMSVEEIQAEWGFWRKLDNGVMPGDAFSASDFRIPAQRRGDALVLEEEDDDSVDEKRYGKEDGGWSPPMARRRAQKRSWMDAGMSSCPAGWAREVYTSPGWIPLLSDRAGNYVGIDLDPPPFTPHDEVSNAVGGGQGSAKPMAGQVIAFGREIDEKVVLWRGEGEQGWGKWLASFAEDLEEREFAEVGGRGRDGRSHRRNRAGSEGGPTAWRGGSGSSDDDDTGSDGLGEIGYFNDGSVLGYGEGGSRGGWRGWRLKGQYRGMGVIEALCHRSKLRWAEVGLHSSRDTVSSPVAGSSSSRSPPQPQVSATDADESTEQLLHSPAGNDDAVASDSNGTHNPDPLASSSSNETTRPGSPPDGPVAFVTPPSPVLDTSHRALRPQNPQDTRRLSQGTLRRPPPRASGGSGSVSRRPRAPPPPVAALGLPTKDDLMREATLTDAVEEEAWSPPGTATERPLINGGHYAQVGEPRSSFQSYRPDSPTSPKLVSSPLSLASLPLVSRLSSEGRRSRQGSKEDRGIGLGTLGRASSSDLPILPTSSPRASVERRGSGQQPMIDDQSPIQVLSTTEGFVGGPPPPPMSPSLGSPLLGSPNRTSGEFSPQHPPPTPPPPTARKETRSPGTLSPLSQSGTTSVESVGAATETEFESAPSSIGPSRSASVMG